MDTLPNELIQKIFSLLDAEILLGPIQLVCKKWTELARHPDSWRNIDLIIPKEMTKEEKLKAARLSRLAPYLRRVDLTNISDKAGADLIVSPLLKDEQAKGIKILHTLNSSTKNMRALTLKMLTRYAFSIREIHISVKGPNIDDHNQTGLLKNLSVDLNKILERVAKLPHLQSIVMYFMNPVEIQNYHGQLGRDCLKLRRLAVKQSSNAGTSWVEVVLDLLKKKKDVLEEVDIGFWASEHLELEVALSLCHGLLKCGLPIDCLPAVKHMSHLYSLKIDFDMDSALMVIDNDLQHPLYKFVLESAVLNNITELAIASNFYSPNEDRNGLCHGLIFALLDMSSKVEVFRVSLIPLDGRLLNRLTSKLQASLKSIYVDFCPKIDSTDILLLSSYPNLKYFQLSFIVLEEDETTKLLDACQDLIKNGINAVVHFTEHCDSEMAAAYFYHLYNDECGDSDSSLDYDDGLDYYYDDYYDEYQFTYLDYLRNKYGEDLPEHELWALASSDEDD